MFALAAGVAPACADAPVITKIVVQGNQRIEPATVMSYLPVRPGDKVTSDKVDQSLKALFETGLFADVTLRQEGSALYVTVVENPIINRVVFEGNKKLKTEDLTKEVKLGPRVVFTRAKVQADVQRIVELYRRSGRFAATVEPKIVELPQNRVDLVFEMNEGPVTGVRRVTFLGNTHFSDTKLKEALATKEERWWRFLSSNTSYDPDRFTYDREVLRRFYLARGYADFRIISAVAELTPDGKAFFLTFNIEEGKRYKFGTVDVQANVKALKKEDLQPLLTMKQGDVYNVEQIDKTIDALTFAAGTKGYAFVDVRPQVKRDREARIISITFNVDEGPRVYVERINVVGNVRTLDRVIRREMRLAEGDAYNRILMDRSKTRIKGLGYFKKVEITQESGTAPDRTVLNVEVQEQSTGELSIGAGYSSIDNFIIDFSVTERNLLGKGQYLRFNVSTSRTREEIELRFTEPYWRNRNMSLGWDIYRIRTDYIDYAGFESTSTGFSVRTGFPLTEYSRATISYTLRQDSIKVDQASCDAGFIASSVCRARGDALESIIGFSYGYDRRDDPNKPTKGYFLHFNEEVAGAGGSERYSRTEAGFEYYHPIELFGWENVIGNISGEAGYIKGLGKQIRLNDRFFKGGDSFRGFETAGVGPRDLVTHDALGGEMYAIGTVAVSFPLGLPKEFGILGTIFSDFGTVGVLHDNTPGILEDTSFRLTAGVGVLWDSPFGPVRIDLANAFIKTDYDQRESFRFSAGTRF